MFGKSPVEFIPWTDADIIICRNIFSKKVYSVSWLLSLIYIIKKSWFVDSGLGGASDEPDTYTFYTKP